MEEPSSSSASTSTGLDTSQGVAAELLAGGFGGAVGVFVGQPLDFVKVRRPSPRTSRCATTHTWHLV